MINGNVWYTSWNNLGVKRYYDRAASISIYTQNRGPFPKKINKNVMLEYHLYCDWKFYPQTVIREQKTDSRVASTSAVFRNRSVCKERMSQEYGF
jgi:hypothetical protein